MSSKYSKEEKIASNKYSSIKSRVKKKQEYDLEECWKREDFIKWYIKSEKKCYYCKSTESEIKSFYKKTDSKRKSTRGNNLEIDRTEDGKYSESNCKLVCYWCNNAKSDVFSSIEFKSIGREIGLVIKEILKLKHA